MESHVSLLLFPLSTLKLSKNITDVKLKYMTRFGVVYNVGFTLQSPNTDTIAVDLDNEPSQMHTEICCSDRGHTEHL